MYLRKSLVAAAVAASSLFSFSAVSAQQADLMITDATVLTMNAAKDVYENGVVVIKGNKILAVGTEELAKKYSAKTTLDVDGDIVLPGLINTHTHASMTVFRSLGDDVPDRLHRYIFPLEKKLVSRDMVRIGANLGNVEMVKGGVTTYADMYYFEDEVAKTVDKIGMRAILGESVIKFPVADAANADEGIQYALNFIEEYKDHPRITPAFAPHAPYTNTTETLQKIAKLSLELDVPVMIHLAESHREEEVIAERSNGMSPVEYMHSIGALNKNLIGAHMILIDDKDIELVKEADMGVAHNMSANIKSAKGVSPALKMYDEDVRIGLGTDGPMSGNTLSIIDEFNQVAKVHKLVNKDRAAMPPLKVIDMATMGAAKALHMEDKIGSLEVGKLADIIVVDTKAPNMLPVYNPYSALVYSANSGNVRHTIVDGEILMKDRELLTVNEDEIRKELIEFTKVVRKTVIDSGEVVQ
ncbi:chlorohydrolase/deaminase family protein [Aliivibrio fischeri ES114]|uniref:Chlorohydrolase/deaminase family protein n=1 Tax=Aliivibrio fischeri (strain ATCC 700601 / ES114) TaxID=312309 RepID=Q5E5P5_ALIF1|nr:amidohydrolase [Aliivibrio fischeri]AAW85651.1 chlorohydrolase/deaminase family protein [Aliivibrio fischeri ES114]KLU80078.1 amidohydrolase [Aliivibrio fischeri]MUI53349.1 amidohydrolase family protein [Aliivibrio fischeri]MUJ28732.1 amidohydrolase family protein [Aliivibrio fischeri]MUK39655.1 amidohydrolase family protein [Aliivibrio fischeri]